MNNTNKQLINDINFDIENKDIYDTREVTIKCNGKRFRILLEVVRSCFGNCSGCSLSYSDRRKTEPEMSIETIQETLKYFIPIINKKNNLRTTVVNFGTGDYFAMEESFLEKLSKTIRIFFDNVNTVRNVITISTSLFLSEEKMLSKIKALKTHLHETQFAIDGVVDPLLLDVHMDRYIRNYKDLKKHFPFFDLVVNLSNSIEAKHLEKFMYFLKQIDVLNFDVQYAINNTNYYKIKTTSEKFKNMMNYIYNNIEEEEINILELSMAIPTQEEDTFTVFDAMQKNAKDIVRERVVVSKNGNIYPIAFGYGDIILDERYDFSPIGNIHDQFDTEVAEKMIFDYLKKLFIKNKACHTCDYNKYCYQTGYAFYNNFNTTNQCENVGRFILEKKIKLQ